jgi:HK97 gp10 family phage protein
VITFNTTQFKDEINASIDRQGIALTNRIEAKARALAPYRHGYLRGSIDAFYDAVSKSIEIYVGAEYGLFQEYGTRYMRAHPYIRPALNAEQIYGFDTTMAFTNTYKTDTKLLARGPGFQMHRSLIDKQKAHVRKYLKPVSTAHYQGGQSNVARARLKVKTVERRKKF